MPALAPGRRILLVEDHHDTLIVLAKLLRHAGYEVRTADTMAAGVASGLAEPFDLLICDVDLPDGDGRQVLRRILEERPIRGIVMSGYGMDADLQASLDAGFVGHVFKPVDLKTLTDAIRRAVPGST